MIGFIVLNVKNGEVEKFFRQSPKEGHIEIAERIIRQLGVTKKYENSQWGKMNNPVDYLVYVEGGVKVGTRWNNRVVTYCPNSLKRKLYKVLGEYVQRSYKIDKVSDPTKYKTKISNFH